MTNNSRGKLLLFLVGCLLQSSNLRAQEANPADTAQVDSALVIRYAQYTAGAPFTDLEIYQLARELAFANDWVKAIDLFTSLLNKDPQNYDALLSRGLVYTWSGAYAQADKDFRIVLAAHPKYSDAWMAQGNNYLWWGQHYQAIGSYSSLISNAQASGEAYLGRAKAYTSIGRYYKARSDLKLANEHGIEATLINNLITEIEARPLARAWQVSVQYDNKKFNTTRARWSSGSINLAYKHRSGLIAGQLIRTRRFDRIDQAYGLNTYIVPGAGRYYHISIVWAVEPQIVPELDVSAAVYQSFAKNWELGLTGRRMSFTTTGVNIWGASLSNYLGPYYFRSSLALVPTDEQPGFSIGISGRRYLISDQTFIELALTSGKGVEQALDGPVFYDISASVLRIESFITTALGFNLVFSHQWTPFYQQSGLGMELIYRR